MTNEEMIEKATLMLVVEGAIEPNETIHTYKKWKELGYHVKKGEKSITTLKLWKHKKIKYNVQTLEGVGSDIEEDGNKVKSYSDYYLTNAYMFSTKQVEK